MMADPVIPVLTGPTAVGKTELSLLLAEAWNAEIISVDSRQIYRGLDIATAKPSAEEMDRVPHHLINACEPDEPISAGRFADMANKCIRDVLDRDRNVIVTGGSTLYLRALTEGLADIPAVDPAIRIDLNHRLRKDGPEQLYKELASVDSEFAASLDPSKSQRIVRGLEVYAGTGRPLSSFFVDASLPPFEYEYIVLNRSRETLYHRINERVDRMVDGGLEAEATRIYGEHPELARSTIGYREFADLQDGKISRDAAISRVKRDTRRYAKRQLTWFRSIAEAFWLDLDSVNTKDAIGLILDRFSGRLHHSRPD